MRISSGRMRQKELPEALLRVSLKHQLIISYSNPLGKGAKHYELHFAVRKSRAEDFTFFQRPRRQSLSAVGSGLMSHSLQTLCLATLLSGYITDLHHQPTSSADTRKNFFAWFHGLKVFKLLHWHKDSFGVVFNCWSNDTYTFKW